MISSARHMYMQVRAPEENNMAITRHRLQQIIKEEVALLLREQEEEGDEGGEEPGAAEAPESEEPEGVEGAVGALENAAYEAARKSILGRIESGAAEQKAAALEELKGLVEKYGIEVDLDSHIAALRKMSSDLSSEADRADSAKQQAEAALDQIGAIIGSVGSAAETVTERWNRLAFGRRIL